MPKLQSALKQFGLNEKESVIYLALLPLGSATASVLSYRTNIQRSTVQYVCQTLNKKGLISSSKKGNTFTYKPEAPEKILYLLDQQKQSLNQKANQASLLVSELNALANTNLLPSNWVKSYQGLDEVLKSYSEFLNGLGEGEEICNYVSPAPITMAGFRKGMKLFIKDRINRQIFAKTICSYGEDAIRLKLTDDYSYRKTLISFENPNHLFFSEILLSENRMLSTSYSGDNVYSYMILDRDIASMHLAIFNLAWRQAGIEDERICKTKEVKALKGGLQGIQSY